jgi:ATP-dependent RNA helicase RhlE
MKFRELEIIEPILKALDEKGYETPSPIQEKAIPILLQGKDLLGCAQTGTGKTAAFAIPILQHLYQNPQTEEDYHKIRALILAPTRELASQIGESFSNYGKYTGLKNTVIYGGVHQARQVKQLNRGVDILVATPGRLLDLMNQKHVSLKDIQYLVLDEADHMLDMGFIHDIRKIMTKVPKKRQSLFFSATMPYQIVALSETILGNHETITIKPEQTTAERVQQAVYYVAKKYKSNLLVHLMKSGFMKSTLVFCRTKHGADKIVRVLLNAGISCDAIHGNKSQGQREEALQNFKNGELRALVATDIAARGIDVEELSVVVNYDLPNVSETYVHRIGRTGRASASGIAVSFCDKQEKSYLRDIQALIGKQIPVIEEHPFHNMGMDEVEEWKKNSKNAKYGNVKTRGGLSRSGKPKNGNNQPKKKKVKQTVAEKYGYVDEEKPEKHPKRKVKAKKIIWANPKAKANRPGGKKSDSRKSGKPGSGKGKGGKGRPGSSGSKRKGRR